MADKKLDEYLTGEFNAVQTQYFSGPPKLYGPTERHPNVPKLRNDLKQASKKAVNDWLSQEHDLLEKTSTANKVETLIKYEKLLQLEKLREKVDR